MAELKYADITKEIIGAAFKVHNTLGNGFQEVIYQRALAIELTAAQLNFIREYEMPIFYAGQHIGTRRVDFLIRGMISVELKAIIKLEDVHIAQAMNYLEAYNLEIGLLINFGSKRLEYHRFTNKKYNSPVINPSLSQSSRLS
jgi:GxxExxY protein